MLAKIQPFQNVAADVTALNFSNKLYEAHGLEASPHLRQTTIGAPWIMGPGESWAYRARQVDPLVEVCVVRLGRRSPREFSFGWLTMSWRGVKTGYHQPG